MKYGLLIYNNSYNFGDEIQSIAAKQFLPQIHYLIDRDSGEITSLNNEDNKDQEIKVIYNGWFDGQYCKFPPSERIKPLFVSFHLNEIDHSKDKSFDFLKKNDKFISLLEYKDFWKRHEPILCRDINTANKFENIKIKSEFSACLTLTLENTIKERGDEILIVDTHCLYPELYKELIPKDIKGKAIHLYQSVKKKLDHDEKMKLAQKHLDKLQSAKLVITSRLHTLLPCIAYKTPVVFIHGDKDDIRFSGLKQFFTIYGKGDVVDFADISKFIVQNDDLDKYVLNIKKRIYEFLN